MQKDDSVGATVFGKLAGEAAEVVVEPEASREIAQQPLEPFIMEWSTKAPAVDESERGCAVPYGDAARTNRQMLAVRARHRRVDAAHRAANAIGPGATMVRRDDSRVERVGEDVQDDVLVRRLRGTAIRTFVRPKDDECCVECNPSFGKRSSRPAERGSGPPRERSATAEVCCGNVPQRKYLHRSSFVAAASSCVSAHSLARANDDSSSKYKRPIAHKSARQDTQWPRPHWPIAWASNGGAS